MPRRPTSRIQVSGHRFLVRRIEHALVRADARMIHDPLRMRSRALIVGVVLAVLALAGAGIAAVLSPHVKLGDAHLVGVRATGALYVRLDGRLHPVPNLASGQLILGRHEDITWIHAKELIDVDLGPGLGISPVPEPPRTGTQPPRAAMICDDRATSSTGDPHVGATTIAVLHEESTLPKDRAILAVDDAGQHWFLASGTRARINPDDNVVWRELGAADTTPRPVSDHLLAVLPITPDLDAPTVPAAGEKTAHPAPFDRVGTLVVVSGQQYLATHSGAVQLSGFQAGLLRGNTVTAAQSALDDVPAAATPQWLTHFPVDRPTWFEDPTLCASYHSGDHTFHLATLPAPLGEPGHRDGAVTLATADGAGPGPDHYLGADFGTFAVDTGHSFGVVSATGQLFPVPDADTLPILGADSEPVQLPWTVIGALEKGPELSRARALEPVAQPPQ
ncbi:type VII secretion protein EccB [Corynebacterium ulceribovis]|uniref:type VII secretion protein EccB n=1 Tax=Corynebacterium ulceribovis TaxID=487732 RepID=UPI0014615AA2|nr:type VII secretion protein EccB [Corynebacterium ulceribovis]